MSESDQRPNIDVRATDQARVNIAGEVNAETVNFGDVYEVQRQILIDKIDPVPPLKTLQQLRTVKKTWIDQTQLQSQIQQTQ